MEGGKTRNVALAALFLICFSGTGPGNGAGRYAVRTVVIDAGHGGHDSGCLGSSSMEKKVTLAIAMRLGEYIEKNFPEVKVVYTRQTDVFVELHERAAIANRAKANLFISIHCNAGAPAACGTETYVMGLHKSKQNLDVAKRENAVILLEENYSERYEGFDPNSSQAYIIFSLNQNAYLEQSIALAAKVEESLETNMSFTSRGIKQAGFLVLYKTAMPSVLIETGFLSHHQEEKTLASPAGQDKIALSIFRAFAAYKNEVEGKTPSEPEKPVIAGLAPVVAETEVTPAPKDTVAVSPAPAAIVNTDTSPRPSILFKVQIAASAKPVDTRLSPYNKLIQIEEEKDPSTGIYRYLTGRYTIPDSVPALQKKVRESGFRDAFAVAYKDGKRVPYPEALKALAARP